jgi:hypothetical protein
LKSATNGSGDRQTEVIHEKRKGRRWKTKRTNDTCQRERERDK